MIFKRPSGFPLEAHFPISQALIEKQKAAREALVKAHLNVDRPKQPDLKLIHGRGSR